MNSAEPYRASRELIRALIDHEITTLFTLRAMADRGEIGPEHAEQCAARIAKWRQMIDSTPEPHAPR